MTDAQDTGKFRKNLKDQFYTKKSVALACINTILSKISDPSRYLWVEPSAGNGSFLTQVPEGLDKFGLDLDPKGPGIIQGDFLTWVPPTGKDIILFGNPPFGRQSALAKAFIRKGCQFASIIAFVLPRSFVKPSMSNTFDSKFHLVHSNELEKYSFVLNEEKYDVPCVFQIWEKKETPRILEQNVEPVGFEYVKEGWDLALRRVGGLAGRCYPNDGTKYSVQSHYFIKFPPGTNLDRIIQGVNSHKFPSNTVGPRSLSKSEINVVLNHLLLEDPRT